jgi:hypothetical protein
MPQVLSPDYSVVYEYGHDDTGGHFGSRTHSFSIASCTPGESANHDFSYPIPVALFAAQLIGNSDIGGDEVEFQINPGYDVGDISVDADSGSTYVVVSDDIFDVIEVGYYLELDDGTNQNDVGMVTSKDADTNTIHFETATTNDFAAATPTEIKMTVKMIPTIELPSASRYEVGKSKIGGNLVAANTTMRIVYTNNDGQAKDFVFLLEYTY